MGTSLGKFCWSVFGAFLGLVRLLRMKVSFPIPPTWWLLTPPQKVSSLLVGCMGNPLTWLTWEGELKFKLLQLSGDVNH